ncbi:MAG: S8 family serine peptidase [Sphingomonas sp.]|nr:S8 family serine peptidase [Sphingomonas sp.]
MKRLLALFVSIAALLSLNGPSLAQGSPAMSPDRQVLVMVRHPPDHYQSAGSYGGDYGSDLTRSARERLARAIARKHGLTFVDGWPMPMIGVDCFIMAVPDGRSTSAAAAELSGDSKIAWAEPVQLYKAESAAAPPNDPLFPAQPAAQQWKLAELHELATGRGTRVAVIDSGIQANHPDLAGQVILNRNFVIGQTAVPEDHGTAVAGIIAAKSGNGIGIAGVAPDSRLLGLRACWQQRGAGTATVCDGLSLAKALYFAIQQKPDVINLSLSGPDDRLLRTLVEAGLARGSVVVAAYDPRKPDGGFPASVPGVIAVSDHGFAGASAHVYIAPGRGIPTTQPGGRWFLVNGSSFAAAHVSGLAALVRQKRRSADLTLVSDRRVGGTIDACATLERAASGCDCSCGSGRVLSARFVH